MSLPSSSVTSAQKNRFEDFFATQAYIELKNSLYNYRLRKFSVSRQVKNKNGLTVEIGSGISPMIGETKSVVYTDLSFSALNQLRRFNQNSHCVVADANKLPFKTGSVENVIFSEVLEHIEDDTSCVQELWRISSGGGKLVITFPHRRCYFANDDRYVSHYRRYELFEMIEKLSLAGFKIDQVEKVLGPMEKITMMGVIGAIKLMGGGKDGHRRDFSRFSIPRWFAKIFSFLNWGYAGLVWLDARAMPRATASVLLVSARKC